jgi:hypothetical protein
MRITIQYIPLNKIKPDQTVPMSQQLRRLRSVIWDCMHLLAVRKNRRDGTFTLLSGFDRYDYLIKHGKKYFAPCIVDESEAKIQAPGWLRRLWNRPMSSKLPKLKRGRISPAGWSIIRTFVKREPRFMQLTYSQQLQVLMLAVRYKKTVQGAMKAKMDEFVS